MRWTSIYQLLNHAGEYLSRTLDNNEAPGELINASQQTNDQGIHDNQNQAHEQKQETRARRRARERAHKRGMVVKNIQGGAAKRRAHTKSVAEGERSALLERRNASFAAKQRSPHPSTLHVNRAATSSETPPTGAASPASSPPSSTPSYTVGTDGNPLIFYSPPSDHSH